MSEAAASQEEAKLNMAAENLPETSSEEKHAFVTPQREILGVMDVMRWEKSEAYQDFLGFILTLNKAVQGKKKTMELEESQAVTTLLSVLDTLEKWIEEIPPIDQPQRFGNKAYRTWFQKMEENACTLITPLIPESYAGAEVELLAYFKDSFGNRTRIDYGTGHEACFGMFLCCLFKLQILSDKDYEAVVFRVFHKYLELTRNLQMTYRMEPAGSQGVWGLDDFQFIPFIWGSSQLIGHPRFMPDVITIPTTVEANGDDYLFFECINFINKVKTGPFAEHSNTLWGISSVPMWTKVNSGLIKMYKAEVLSKFPVIQHFVFGSILSMKPQSPFKKPH